MDNLSSVSLDAFDCYDGPEANQTLACNETSPYEPIYEPPLSLIVFLSLCYGSISVAAVIGNGLVIWVIVTSRRMRNVTNYYIANLALADIVIGLFAIPFEVSRFLYAILIGQLFATRGDLRRNFLSRSLYRVR
ncbi:hypothetical protein AAG570_010929 [Ranatra chinensis]|uniref:G-protein coupled receptors family 1 profile domain-containing protein n=1 Tax=Ranatra chinensis TaxID=642074 RepID=A0ABD0YJ47_9HEMI